MSRAFNQLIVEFIKQVRDINIKILVLIRGLVARVSTCASLGAHSINHQKTDSILGIGVLAARANLLKEPVRKKVVFVSCKKRSYLYPWLS